MNLISLGSVSSAVHGELKRVRQRETLLGFPQFIVLPDGTSPPALHLHDMPIETKPTLELSLYLSTALEPAFALVELPRRVLRAPGQPPVLVFDRLLTIP